MNHPGRVLELVYSRDLKSRGLVPCGFESHPAHHSTHPGLPGFAHSKPNESSESELVEDPFKFELRNQASSITAAMASMAKSSTKLTRLSGSRMTVPRQAHGMSDFFISSR